MRGGVSWAGAADWKPIGAVISSATRFFPALVLDASRSIVLGGVWCWAFGYSW